MDLYGSKGSIVKEVNASNFRFTQQVVVFLLRHLHSVGRVWVCHLISYHLDSFGPCLAVCLHHSLPGPKRYQRYFLVLGSRIAVVLRWTNHVPGATSLQSGSQTVDKLDNLNQILPSTGDPGFVLYFHVFSIRWSPCTCFRLHTLALALTFSSVSQHRLRRNCEASWWHCMRMPLVRLGQNLGTFDIWCFF